MREFVLNFDRNGTVSIGRGRCDLALPHPQMSMEHCELSYEGGRLWLRNYDPAFGTFLQVRA